MIKSLAALAVLALSGAAFVAGPVTDAPAAAPKCPAMDRLPFPLPSQELSAEWTDTEWTLWETNARRVFCAGRESSAACRCLARTPMAY